MSDDDGSSIEPYYLRSFEAPLRTIYERYKHLWLPHEDQYYHDYTNTLTREEKLIFIKLLLRSHKNVYELSEVAERYYKIVHWKSSYTAEEIDKDKELLCSAIKTLITKQFFTQWTPIACNQNDDINALKSLGLPSLKQLIQGLPDGKEVLKKYKKKDELIVWLINRLEKYGDQMNPFTRKKFSEIVWDRFNRLDDVISYRFLVNKLAGGFFKRLHLLNQLFTMVTSGTGCDIESLLTESLKPGILDQISTLEYVKHDTSRQVIRPLFSTRQELHAYEQALTVVQQINLIVNNHTNTDSDDIIRTLGNVCVTHLLKFVKKNNLQTTDDIPCAAELIEKLDTQHPDNDPCDDVVSLKSKLEDHVLRRFTCEYLYSQGLYELCQLIEAGLSSLQSSDHTSSTKDYDTAVTWYSLIMLVHATRMNRGKIFLRLLLDTRIYLQNANLSYLWALRALQESHTLEPGFVIDIAKQIQLLIKSTNKKGSKSRKRKPLILAPTLLSDTVSPPPDAVVHVVDDDSDETKDNSESKEGLLSSPCKKARGEMIQFKGIYQQVLSATSTTTGSRDLTHFSTTLINLEKSIDAIIPIKILTGKKFISSKTRTPASSDIDHEEEDEEGEDAQSGLGGWKSGLSGGASSVTGGRSGVSDGRSGLTGGRSGPGDTKGGPGRSISGDGERLINSKFLWNDQWVSVEQFALQNYLAQGSDEFIESAENGFYSQRKALRRRPGSKLQSGAPTNPSQLWVGCHCEGSIVRELISLTLFPIIFNSHVCPPNAHAFITDTQTAPCDLGTTDFYEVRKSQIHGYISLWQLLDEKVELAFLISLLSCQLYEVRVMSATWTLDTNHPNAFKPEVCSMREALTTPKVTDRLPPRPQLYTPKVSPMIEQRNDRGGGTMRKTPTSKWQTPKFKGRLPLRKIGQTKETNLILGYDRGVTLLPKETIDVGLDRRFESGLAYGVELAKVACGIGNNGIAQIMLHMCKCFPYWSNGLPDLLLWKNIPRGGDLIRRPFHLSPACLAIVAILVNKCHLKREALIEKIGIDIDHIDLDSWLTILSHQQDEKIKIDLLECIEDDIAKNVLTRIWQRVVAFDFETCKTVFSEVKGPGDALSQKQRLWLYAMIESGIQAHVCEVRAPS